MAKLTALIDGSAYAESVCDHAAWIAGRTGLGVEVMHVLGRRETAGTQQDLSGSIALGARTTLLQELSALDEQKAKLAQARGRALLDGARGRLEADGIGDVAQKLRIGDLVDTVGEVERDSDLIVIGKRGEAADFAKGHLGSNLERVARTAKKPVFVAARAFRPVKSVLIAFDGGTSSLKAVDHVAHSPLFADLTFRVLMVEKETPAARKALDGARAILEGAGHTVTAEIVEGHADAVIAKTVEEAGIDLLVMGAFGHSRIRKLIIGSTASEMVRSCKIPVMLVR